MKLEYNGAVSTRKLNLHFIRFLVLVLTLSTLSAISVSNPSDANAATGTCVAKTADQDGFRYVSFLSARPGTGTTTTEFDTCTWTIPTGVTSIEYLVVGGGGGGGSRHKGGGGAGGFRTATSTSVANLTSLAIQVGLGGQGGQAELVANDGRSQGGFKGGDSKIAKGAGAGSFTEVISAGGGGGNGGATIDGGSGGGIFGINTFGISSPVTSPVQGYAGAVGNGGSPWSGGGGGGAGGAGATGLGSATGAATGAGGVGAKWNDNYPNETTAKTLLDRTVLGSQLSGTTVFFAAGGGGGSTSGEAATSAVGGGGVGTVGRVAGGSGLSHSGSGGGASGEGGGATPAGGNGGSGVVIIRYVPVTITSLSVSSDVTGGGATTVVTGTNLTSVTSATIGGNAATVGANTSTSVTLTVPAGTVGPKDVVITNSLGTVTSTGGFAYYTTLTPACGTSGLFTIENNIVITSTSCVGTVTIPEGVTSVRGGGGAPNGFYFAAISGTVTLPSTLKTLGDQSFYGTGQINVVIPKSVTDISGAFWTSNITAVSFETPASITSIGASTFRSNPNLTSLVIPEGVTTIGNIAIASNSKLRTVTMPSTIATITGGGNNSFQGSAIACVVNTSNNAVVNGFAWPVNPVNFPSSTNAFTSAAPKISSTSAGCDMPTITSLSTSTGGSVGGTSVVINGTNLTGTRAVKIGTFNATVGAVTATAVTITTPVGIGSNLDIHLVADGGWLTSGAGIKFSYSQIATKVAVTRQSPNASAAGIAFGIQPKITILDAVDYTVSATSQVVASISAGATLQGTTSVNAVAGVATFANLGIATGTAGDSYAITYTVAGLTVATQSVRVGRSCDGSSFTCQVGDIGPGGGTIFYVAPTTFTQTGASASMCSDDCKYLEVAPNTWPGGGATADPRGSWSNNKVTTTGQDVTTASTEGYSASEKVNWKIGQGFYNTSVMAVTGATSAVKNAVVAYQGSGNTVGQWFLPSMNELNELCKWASGVSTGDLKVACVSRGTGNLMVGFAGERYWSSSENNAANSWAQRLDTALVVSADKEKDSSNNYVAWYRPIRAFAPPPTYAITLAAGSNATGTSQSLTKVKGTNLTLPNSATTNGYFSRAGYTITAFSTSDGGVQTHTLGGTFTTDAITTLYPVWNANTLTVTYDAKGGSSVTSGSTVTGGSISAAPTAPTKAGYTFGGWSLTDGGSAVTFPLVHGKTANFSLYALWSTNTYVLTYVYNGATSDTSTATSSFTTGGTAIILPTPTRTGYTFGNWYADDQFTTLIGLAGAGYSPNGTSLTPSAYAKWTGISRTVTYSATTKSSGDVPTDSASYLIGASVPIQGNSGSLVRTGYEFIGWTYASDGTGPVLNSGSTYTTETSNMVFYAKWSANTYTVTYNKNGANGSPTAASATYTTGGTAITLTTVGTMTKTGFDFGGWSTTPTGSALTGTYTTSANVALYAVWTIKSIAITFAKGAASAETFTNFPANRSSNYGTTITLNDPVDATKDIGGFSHAFMGWNDGSTTYQNGYSYQIQETPPTFTAIWVKIFAVRYAFNGGTPAADTSDIDSECLASGNTCTDNQEITANVAPSRAGYTFAGWVDQNNVAVTAGGKFRVAANRYLIYANWTAIDYTITYNTAGGSTAPTPFTKQRGQTFLVADEPTRTGYTFTNWSDETSIFGPGVTYYVLTSAVTLTAQWQANTYTISYDWNGGTGSTTNNDSYTVGGSAVTLPGVGNHVKDGYTFGGWSATRGGTQVSDSYTPTSNVTLFARWGTGSYTITYDANGGSVGTNSASILNGSSLTLPTPTRNSFVFDGWYTLATGGPLLGLAAAPYTPTQSRTAYAHWTQASLYGIAASDLTRIGTATASSSGNSSFTFDNGISSVSVSVPAGSLPNGTTIAFDLVGSFTRAQSVLTAPNTYIVSMVVSWLTPSGTVDDTAADKPISLTIANSTIKAGMKVYGIVGGVATLLGTATQNGTVTVAITSDPEVVVVSTKPNSPTGVAATSNETAQSVVTWTAPSDGGSSITGYTVTSSGGQTCTTVSTSCTVASLANGTTYTFTVTATNPNGTSAASASAFATTAGKPGAPTSVSASAGGTRQSVIAWTAPVSDGGSAITGYTATATGGANCTTASTTCTITGLSDGTTYTFTVTATNAFATSDPSASANAKTADAAGGGGGGAPTPEPPAPVVPAPTAPVKSNVTISPPVTVVGDKDAKVITVEIAVPAVGSDSKPAVLKVDTPSEKFIAEVKITDGKLVLTPETGFSGKRIVTVSITENGAERFVQVPLTVLPENVSKPVLTPTASSKSVIRWGQSPNANAYTVFFDGKRVCSTSATSCIVNKILGPDSVVEVVSNGGDRTISDRVEADFKQTAPVVVTRIVSATITKGELSSVDTKALEKVVALVKTQGFRTIVISNITTTKKTTSLAAARIAAIKKFIDDKTGTTELTFEVIPAASRTYFNNISVKG